MPDPSVSRSASQSVWPGQTWGLWVYDDALYEQLTVERISDDGKTAYGKTEDNSPCVVGVKRLVERGDLLGYTIRG